MTGELSGSVRTRAEKLQMQHLYLGVTDKVQRLETVLRDTGTTLDQLAYIGDDVNDRGIIELLTEHGLTAAPGDALPVIAKIVHYRCAALGGHGAFREFADWILRHRLGERAGRRQAPGITL
jgi:3-deoxy-D-manno-octulosonate 8-phosphate phosphatase (KDO 8-P phosphatase)